MGHSADGLCVFNEELVVKQLSISSYFERQYAPCHDAGIS